ncbi:MAG: exosortase K [Saprospiraceae bacterium]
MEITTIKTGNSINDLPYYGIVALIFIGAKLIYPHLATDDLKILLTPVSYLVSFFTGSPMSFSMENGYHLPLLNIVIDKSCSGFNFWLIGFIVVSFSMISSKNHYLLFGYRAIPELSGRSGRSESHKITGIIASIIIAYILTILANTSRIVSIIKMNHIFPTWNEQYEWLHVAQGTFVYLFFLIGFYLFLNYKRHKVLTKISK